MPIDFNFDAPMAMFAELGEVPKDVHGNVKKALTVTARYVKDDSRKKANRRGLKAYAASIDYDVEVSADAITAEIGPNLDKRMGSFGFVEEGGQDVKSAPQHALKDAAKKNEADFIKGLEEATGVVLK